MYVFGGNSPTYNVDKHHGIWRFLWGVSNSHIWGRFPWPWTELNYWVWNHYIELWKIGFNKPLDLKSSKQAIGRNHPCRNSPFVLHFISQIRVIPISQSHLVVVHGGNTTSPRLPQFIPTSIMSMGATRIFLWDIWWCYGDMIQNNLFMGCIHISTYNIGIFRISPA